MIGKNHIFHRAKSVQEAEGGGQKFVPAIENDASPIRSPAVFITLFLTRLFNRVFVLCLHNSITVIIPIIIVVGSVVVSLVVGSSVLLFICSMLVTTVVVIVEFIE